VPKKPVISARQCCEAAPTNVWSRNSAAITKKNHAVARCAGVRATSPPDAQP
jgi:hypothetical protein